MRRYQDMPIQGKLMAIIVGVSAAVLLIALLAFTSYGVWTNWQHAVSDLTTLAKVAGINSAAALMFDDRRAAAETLAVVGANPSIIAAYVLTDDRQVFAQYRAPGWSDLEEAVRSRSVDELIREAASASLWRLGEPLVVTVPITLEDQPIGLVLIQAETRELITNMRHAVLATLAAAAVVLLIVFQVSSRLQGLISVPLLRLVNAMRTIATGKNYDVSLEIRSKDEIGTLYDGFNAMLQTIRERTQELRTSEERYRLLVEAANSVILTWDTTGRVLFINDYGERFFGFLKTELIGRNVIGTIVPEQETSGRDLGRLMEEIRRDPERFRENENENSTRDGRRVWVRWANKAVMDGEGRLTGILSVGSDITARRQMEAALREKSLLLETMNRTLEQRVAEEVASRARGEQMLVQQSKLAAMGEMLGAIAHQWRQPLNTLALIVQNLRDAQAYGELNKEYLDQSVQKAMAQIQHMSSTIEDFRNFFLPDRERTVFDAMRAVGDVLSLFSAQLSSSRISYRLTCHTHGRTFEDYANIMLCPEKAVEGYHNEFEHVILNLLDNAKHSILQKREREPLFQSEQGLLTFDFTHEGGKVVVEVGDNGGGIPDDAIDRIFEPYFTTKDPARGTGLGLYMSKVIIEDHMQGVLTARNSGFGAVFRIELPQAAGRGVP